MCFMQFLRLKCTSTALKIVEWSKTFLIKDTDQSSFDSDFYIAYVLCNTYLKFSWIMIELNKWCHLDFDVKSQTNW